MPTDTEFDPAAIDFAALYADQAGVRAVNAHRYEMELLTGVVSLDPANHRIVGFKDLGPDEFWVRGHMPAFPLMPGVLMIEAAAQLTAYYTTKTDVMVGQLMGLGGVEEARFVRMVRPGERLVMVGEGIKVHRRLTRMKVTGYVGREKAFEAVILGVPLGRWEDLPRA